MALLEAVSAKERSTAAELRETKLLAKELETQLTQSRSLAARKAISHMMHSSVASAFQKWASSVEQMKLDRVVEDRVAQLEAQLARLRADNTLLVCI